MMGGSMKAKGMNNIKKDKELLRRNSIAMMLSLDFAA